MSTAQLRHEAQKVGRSGGILCHTAGQGEGCASAYMRRLTYELVERAFPASYRGWALCVVSRESGFNPAALSPTGDHGLAQINYMSHPWIDTSRIAFQTSQSPTGWGSDVLYSLALFKRVSDDGAYHSPWSGGRYSC